MSKNKKSYKLSMQVIGMLITCILIMLFLNRVVVRPLSSVQLTLKDYMLHE